MAKNREQEKIFKPLSKASTGRLKLQRIESSTGDGIPDVIGTNRSGRGFWLELKYLEDWPKRDSTCPLKGCFERGQKGFLTSWNDWNFVTFVLLKVDLHYYLLHPNLSLDGYNKSDLLRVVAACGNVEAIIDHLENEI